MGSRGALNLHGVKRIIQSPYFVLLGIITLTFLCAYGRYIWGGDFFVFTDAGSDCADEYYPTYVYIVNQIREGTLSLWNHSVGLGYDTLTRQERLMDPFAWLIMGVGVIAGEQAIAPMLVVAQYLKIVASGLLAYKLLGLYKLQGGVRIIGAYLYAFNSFLIIWGQHYWFGAASVYMVILLIVAEKWVQNLKEYRKWSLIYSAAVCSVFLYSVYTAYMAVVVISFYILFRHLYETDQKGAQLCKELLQNGVRLVGMTILGVLMAGIMVLPFIDNNLLISARISTESIWMRILDNLIHPYNWEYYFGTFVRAISGNSLGINSLGGGYYGHPLLSISIVGLPFVLEGILEFGQEAAKKRKKSVYGSGLAAIGFLICVPLGSMILNAFQYAFGRYTFVLLPLICIVFTKGMERICSQYRMNWLATGILVGVELIALMASVFLYENNDFIRDWVKFVLLWNALAYVIMLTCVISRKRYVKTLLYLLLVVGCIQETFVSSSSEERQTMEELKAEDRRITERIIESLQEEDPGFFRIDKTYNDFRWLGDPLIERLNIPTGYNSTLNKNIVEFYEKVWPEVCTGGDTRVTTTRGFIMDGKQLEEDNVLTLLGVKYIISKEEISDLKGKYKLLEGDFGERYVYRNTEAESIVTAFESVISESEFEGYREDEKRQLLTTHLILSDLDMEGIGSKELSEDEALVSDEKPDNQYFMERLTDTYLRGTIKLEEQKYMMFAIPYRPGWSIYANDEKLEILQGNYGFLACKMPIGTHTVEIKYENPIYVVGVLATLVGIGLWGSLWYNKRIKEL